MIPACILIHCCHVAFKLTGLNPDTTYYYRVGAPGSKQSEVFEFSTNEGNLVYAVRNPMALYQNSDMVNNRYSLCHFSPFASVLCAGQVYGDLGFTNAVSLGRLKSEVKQGSFHAVLHVGGLAKSSIFCWMKQVGTDLEKTDE